MERPVYRSLDRKNSFLGLKGSYLMWALSGMAVFGGGVYLLLKIAGFDSTICLLALIAAVAGVYLGIKRLQQIFTERERDRWLVSFRLNRTVKSSSKTFSMDIDRAVKPSKSKHITLMD